jgi:hypothetical protein
VPAPDLQSEVDVLAQGGRTRAWSLPAVPVPVRRLLLALLVVAVVAGWLVDQRLRDAEATRLDACAARATGAVEAALGPVRAMSEYVRPTLAGTLPGGLRRDLYALVADRAGRVDGAGQADGAGRADGLAGALAACREVPVLAVHEDLRARRASCELLVGRTIDYLDRVARDGREAFRSAPAGAGSAASCAG